MNIELLKRLGNIDQIAGIRVSTLRHGRGSGMDIAEFYNAAGLRFTVLPDRCMDLNDLSYKGINLSFQSKNGLISGASFESSPGSFCDEWPGGMLATCGLDNVGEGYDDGDIYPTHGRIASIPADHFGTSAGWQGDEYVLCATGQMQQSRLFGRNLLLERTLQTTLNSKSITLTDRLTNREPEDEPFMLLYHFNFGHPLLTEESVIYHTKTTVQPRGEHSKDHLHMTPPVDGQPEEFFQHITTGKNAACAIVNPALHLGAYIRFDTENLPYFGQWKNMRSHDYVLAIEPCNCFGKGRRQEIEEGTIATIKAYSTLEFRLELGVLDGDEEIAKYIEENC